ncbi:hypothetical protein EJ08DRAFT_611324 [Tothia fuscella]|uniref:Uncharacterized protein n=1 Tax=Tothia fuscella TaxID=1048955 RepID=A0A9P4NS16_9PEZI|nr:hypothetical protein EJ08DRAFT_611324 [Tothia fuscella]
MPPINLTTPIRLARPPRPSQLPCLRLTLPISHHHLRNASSSTTPNDSNLRPLILEKPDKFRPPSHPARIKPKNTRWSQGPPLSDEDIKRQKTKKYPNMMPPEGTVMYYFLTNRSIHIWISMGTLLSLAGYIFLTDFHSKNRFPDMLPPKSMFFSHPFQYLRQYAQVYRLHVEAVSRETAEKRARQVDDARKRREYLRAHGMEKPGLFGFGTVEQDEQAKKLEEDKRVLDELRRRELESLGDGETEGGVPVNARSGEYVDFEGNKKQPKKWFGIW